MEITAEEKIGIEKSRVLCILKGNESNENLSVELAEKYSK